MRTNRNTSQNKSEFYYRLPINLEFVARAYRDESPDIHYFVDLLTGGVFSLRAPDGDLERACEGFDHEIRCAFLHTPERFLCVGEFTPREKKRIVEEFASSLFDQALGERLREAASDERPFATEEEALVSRPGELCRWREHLEKASAAAVDFLKSNGVMTEPLIPLDRSPVLEATLFMN